MITASHNPPQDNGYKLYLGDGAQIVGPVDEEISACIDAVGAAGHDPAVRRRRRRCSATTCSTPTWPGRSALVPPGPRDLVDRLHRHARRGRRDGARGPSRRPASPPPHEVAAQVEPDPDFPTVAFPNPEEPGALDLSLALAARGRRRPRAGQRPRRRPARRWPCPIRPPTAGWRALTGDELGTLLADHLLRQGGHGPDDVLATTVVSSRLLSKLAAAAGVAYGEALTGFKWVVRTPQPGQRFLFGYEEALGYCVGRLVRDKDGVSAALVAAELAAGLEGRGPHRARAARRDLPHPRRPRHPPAVGPARRAATGSQRVTAAMASVRATPPDASSPGAPVARGGGPAAPARASRRATCSSGRSTAPRLVVRPSGTEPKLKVYAEAVVPGRRRRGVSPCGGQRRRRRGPRRRRRPPRQPTACSRPAARRCRRGGRRRRRGPG